MRVQIKSRHELSALDRASLEKTIQHLERLTERYGQWLCHLQVTVDDVGHSTGRDVKMALGLGRHGLLVVEERASFVGPAAHRCAEALARGIARGRPRVARGRAQRRSTTGRASDRRGNKLVRSGA